MFAEEIYQEKKKKKRERNKNSPVCVKYRVKLQDALFVTQRYLQSTTPVNFNCG